MNIPLLTKFLPDHAGLIQFYWGSIIAFFGVVFYIWTDYLFFIYAPTFIIGIIKELKKKEPNGWNVIYFVETSVIILMLILYKL